MSYDVYLWFRANTADMDELLEQLSEHDGSGVEPHESVAAFRRELLRTWPQLADVIEPEEADAFVILTLPYGWLDFLAPVLQLAERYGLSGWDPQHDEPLGHGQGRPDRPQGSGRDLNGPWTADHLANLGLTPKWIKRAWDAAVLPEVVTFGEAVGAFVLALALRDGAKVDAETARDAVAEVAARCAHGVPADAGFVRIDYCMTDVSGYAEAIASGRS